jgi:hypothetical protein
LEEAEDEEVVDHKNFDSLGFAFGKETLVYLLFNEHRRKIAKQLWKDNIEPYKGEDLRLKFEENGNSYDFFFYNNSVIKGESKIGFHKGGLKINNHYTKFKNQLKDEVLLTFGISDGNWFKIFDKYKIINNVDIPKKNASYDDSNMLDSNIKF